MERKLARMAIRCPNCHQDVKSTDGFCENCGLKIDNTEDPLISQYPGQSSQGESPRLLAGNSKKVCKNENCANYNVEYGKDENYCGVCGSRLTLEIGPGTEAQQQREHDQQQLQQPPPRPPPAAEPEDKSDFQKRSRGYLVLPDGSEIEITTTQASIGRMDLSKCTSDTDSISRKHITVVKEVSKEGERYFVEDGKTTVQEKPSKNKTWILSDEQQKEEITEKGRRELKDGDQIIIADTVTLSFALRH